MTETQIENIEELKRKIIESKCIDECPKPPLPQIGEHSNYIFISYPHNNYKQVYCDLLYYYQNGVRYWYDSGLTAGVNWREEVEQRITDPRCSGIVYYLSENSFTDSMVFEIGCSKKVAQGNKKGGKNYFSINMDGKQAIELYNDGNSKKLIKTSQDGIGLIFSTFPTEVTYIKRVSDPADTKHIDSVISTFRDYFAAVGYGKGVVKKKTGDEPCDEFSLFEVKKSRNGKYAIVSLKAKSETDITVPDGVEEICDGAFAGCRAVQITLPEGVIRIGKRAFADCSRLANINFPSSLLVIDDKAFYGCVNLDSDGLPEKVRIGSNVFKGALSEKILKEEVKRKSIEGKKPKDKLVAIVLCVFLGIFGAHKFYEGKTKAGVTYVIFTVIGIITLIFEFGIIFLLSTMLVCAVDFIRLLFKPNPYYV